MSEFHVNVVKIGAVEKHPNADSLSVAKVFDYSVIIKTGECSEGQLAEDVPIDSLVPDTEIWSFLRPEKIKPGVSTPEKYRRIRAKKIRGIFSQGMLAKLPDDTLKEGDNVCELMNIQKYEGHEEILLSTAGDCEASPKHFEFVKYTDIEGLRRYPNILEEGETVVITEKIHGSNYRAVHDGTRLWVGSRQQVKAPGDNIWWDAAAKNFLEEKLAKFPMLIFFGEIYGKVQDLKYGVDGIEFRCFDTFSLETMQYNHYATTLSICKNLNIPVVPELYCGKWSNDLKLLAEGNSTLANHVREGFVVKPIFERYHRSIGRVILKMIGEGYMLR